MRFSVSIYHPTQDSRSSHDGDCTHVRVENPDPVLADSKPVGEKEGEDRDALLRIDLPSDPGFPLESRRRLHPRTCRKSRSCPCRLQTGRRERGRGSRCASPYRSTIRPRIPARVTTEIAPTYV